MSQAELYIYLALAVLLLSLLPAAVFFCRIPRKKKKEVLMEMGSLSMGLPLDFPPSGSTGSQTVVHSSVSNFGGEHRNLPPLDDQQPLPLETSSTWDSGLPSYEEAVKSQWADVGLD